MRRDYLFFAVLVSAGLAIIADAAYLIFTLFFVAEYKATMLFLSGFLPITVVAALLTFIALALALLYILLKKLQKGVKK